MEFEKQIAKKGWQTANAKFMGLDSEPMTGTGPKGPYRKVKVRFQLDGKEKENKFVMWTPFKSDKSKYKSDEELKQFGMYHIAWVEKEESYQDKEWVSKTICIINDPKDETEQTSTQSSNQQYSQGGDYLNLKLPNKEQFEEFNKNYFVQVPKEQQSSTDYLGTMFRTFNMQSDVVQDYVDEYKKNGTQ